MATEKPLSTQEYLANWEQMDSDKRPWLIHFQAIAEIFFTRKMDFTRVIIPGQFLQADVFDNTAQFALHLAASVFLSYLWPESARTFELEPVEEIRDVPGVEDYMRWATKRVHRIMDQPKAGLSVALLEYLLDLLAFGTSGVGTFENPDVDTEPEVPVLYDAWGIKNMNISETAQGYVDTIYYVRPLTVRQLVNEYSRPGDKIPPKVMELYEARKYTEKIDVLVVIEPKKPEAGKKGQAGMKVRTVHIAKDHTFRMRVSAYEEMPIHVGRQYKSLDEVLGRSSAMMALPDAQSANVLAEAILVASEKQLDPPLVVLDSGRLGGGVVDTSASAINVYDTGGRLGQEKPIQPLFTVGEFNHAVETLQSLWEKIMQAFLLDRLLDTNNKVQMTAYETSVRDHKSGQAAGGTFGRQEKEVFTPMVQRTVKIAFRKGYLGIVTDGIGGKLRAFWEKLTGGSKPVVPDVIVKAHAAGLDFFRVKYVSPAARFQQGEKLRGLMQAVDTVIALAPVIPGVTDNIDGDKTVRDIYEYTGAPMNGVRTLEDLKKFRAANRQKQDQQEKLAAAEQQSNTNLKNAQARVALGTAAPAAPGAQNG